jgi:hypothetical protein
MHTQNKVLRKRAAFSRLPSQEKKFPGLLLETTFFFNQPRINTMVKGSKLLAALDREKGVDHKLERQKKQQKAAEKRKRSRVEDQEDEAVLEDAIKEAEEPVAGAAGLKKEKKDKKGAKRARVEQGDEEEEEWETDDEDKTHAVCELRYCLWHIARPLY